jgi:hypothetical protein
MNRVAFFIDGWFMRKHIMTLNAFAYTAGNTRRYCLAHLIKTWGLLFIFKAPYRVCPACNRSIPVEVAAFSRCLIS